METINYKRIFTVLAIYSVLLFLAILISGCTRKVHTTKTNVQKDSTVFTLKKDSSYTLSFSKQTTTTYYGDTLRGNLYLPFNLGVGSNTVEDPVRSPVEDSLESNGLKIKASATIDNKGNVKINLTGVAKPTQVSDTKEQNKKSGNQSENNTFIQDKGTIKTKDKTSDTKSSWQPFFIIAGIIVFLFLMELFFKRKQK